MSGEVHSSLIHHALRKVGGIGRVVRGEYTQELVPAGEQAVVIADVREELERRRRGRDGGEDDVLVRREAVPGLLQAGDPPARARGSGHLMIQQAGCAVGGHRQARIRGVRQGAQVAAPRRAAVGRAPHVNRINVTRPHPVGPRQVYVVAVERVHGDRQGGPDALLSQRRRVGPGDGHVCRDETSGEVVRWFHQVAEGGRPRRAAVVAHHDDVARDVRSRVRAPAEVRYVYGVILCHGGPDGRTILPRGVAGFDATGRVGRAPVERDVDGGGAAVRCVEIIEAHVHAIGVVDGGRADERLIDVGAEPLQYHGRGREQVVRLELVEGEVGHLHDSGVQHGRVAPDGVGDIGRHRLAGEGVAERPGVASIVGDENGRGRAGGAAGIRREGGGRHETRVRGVQRQEWLGVLPAFATQRDRDQVHNPYARQLGRWLWHFSL